jgi:DNA mismatch endonuclease (patch repair protein)
VADIFSPSKRSWIMSRVTQRNTRPELLVAGFLRSRGLRVRLHVKKLPGTPDIVLPDLKKAVFVNGCFWHQHPKCPRASLPKSHRTFWVTKLARNTTRDRQSARLLRKDGWSVITLWECRLNNVKTRQICLNRFAKRLEKR